MGKGVLVRIVLLAALGALVPAMFTLMLGAGEHVSGRGVLRLDPVDAPIALPRGCNRAGFCERTFELHFPRPLVPDRPLSVYVPYYTGNIRITVNGVAVADSAYHQSSVHLGQGAPILEPLDDHHLRDVGNVLLLRLEARTGYGGFVGPVYVGPDALLRPAHDRARASVVIVQRLVDGMLLAVGGIMLLVWLVRRHETLFLVCAAISLCFAVSSLSAVAADTVDDRVLVVINLLRLVGAALTLPFAWLLVGQRPRIAVGWFLLLPAIGLVAAFLLPPGWGVRLVVGVLVPVSVLLILAAIAVLARAVFVQRDGNAVLVLVALSTVVLLVARDGLANAGVLPGGHLAAARFNGSVVVVMMGAIVLRRLAAGMAALEHFNVRLREDVAAAETALRAAFERERAQAHRATLQTERVRLMGDLHDGIAGQLMSIIALAEQGDASPEVARASSHALTDLRLVVDSLEDVGDDLGMTLAVFRERIEPQLRRSDVRLDWQVRALPDLPGLSPAATLAIFRILQEAVNNAVRHSGSTVVEVSSGVSDRPGHGARLVVRDHGNGGAAERRGGHGMGNMQRRAAALGAHLDVESGPGGTRVVLDLPEALATA